MKKEVGFVFFRLEGVKKSGTCLLEDIESVVRVGFCVGVDCALVRRSVFFLLVAKGRSNGYYTLFSLRLRGEKLRKANALTLRYRIKRKRERARMSPGELTAKGRIN